MNLCIPVFVGVDIAHEITGRGVTTEENLSEAVMTTANGSQISSAQQSPSTNVNFSLIRNRTNWQNCWRLPYLVRSRTKR